MNEVQSRDTVSCERGVETTAHLACNVLSNVLPQQGLDVLSKEN